jgi:predicted ATPase
VLRAVRDLVGGDGSAPAGGQAVRRRPAADGTLPRGTVTLLRAEVEQSVQQVHDLGDAWLAGLTRQRQICRDVIAGRHGQQVPADHDAVLAAFARAEDAVRAAAELQRALLEADWGEAPPVATRIGVHTGSPQVYGDGYAGLDVDRTIRVAAAAHAGQVLLTDPTVALVEGVTTIDLGDHMLHEVPGRLGLHQLLDPDLPRDFPPVRTLGAAGSLPAHLAPMVGRDDELAELAALIDRGERLVTLVGPGGTGKTRLAVALAGEVAGRFPDGVYFVPLAPVTQAADVWSAMAGVLELPPDGQAPTGFLEHVAGRRLLLVLDNLEQIADGDVVVRDLLAAQPRLGVVATSRRPLHVAGEREHAVPPLAEAAAVQMFVDAASRVRRGFALTQANADDVSALVAALDGLPLAIELTAARAKLLSPAAILARIEQSLDHASADRSRHARHVTLRSTIAWSVDLLGEDQRAVLDALGAFEGGASLDAVDAVVPAGLRDRAVTVDLLFDLVDASLVRVADSDDGEPRFDLLVTVRRFVRERLTNAGVLADVEGRHAQWCYDLAVEHWHGREDASSALRHRVLAELANFRAATERAGRVEDGRWYSGPVPLLHVVCLLAGHAFALRRYAEAVAWAEAALGTADADADPVGRTAALALLAQVRRWSGVFDESAADAERALASADTIPADAGAERPPWVDPDAMRLLSLYNLGSSSFVLGRIDKGLECLDAMRALSREPGDAAHQAALEGTFFVGINTGDYETARAALDELGSVSGSDVGWRRSMVANGLADLDVREGRYAAAQQRLALESEATLAMGDIEHVLIQCETLAEAVGLREPLAYARVLGSAAATREREALPRRDLLEDELAELDGQIRERVTAEEFAAAYERGRGESIVDLFRDLAVLPQGG